MYNYTYTPVTVKVVCTILYSPETSLQWAATHLHLTLNHGFPIIRLSQPKKIAQAKPLAHFSRTGGYGNRTPGLLRRKPRKKPLHHQPPAIVICLSCLEKHESRKELPYSGLL